METTETVSTQDAEAIAAKLEWLARDIRGKARTGDLTIYAVREMLATVYYCLPVEEHGSVTTISDFGPTADSPAGVTDRRNARLELQAERAAQEIERQEPRTSRWWQLWR